MITVLIGLLVASLVEESVVLGSSLEEIAAVPASHVSLHGSTCQVSGSNSWAPGASTGEDEVGRGHDVDLVPRVHVQREGEPQGTAHAGLWERRRDVGSPWLSPVSTVRQCKTGSTPSINLHKHSSVTFAWSPHILLTSCRLLSILRNPAHVCSSKKRSK